MNDFELRAWETQMGIEKLKIHSMESGRDRGGWPLIMMKISYDGIPVYTGKRYENGVKETKMDFASRKIEYMVSAIQCLKEGYEDSRIIEESLRWKILSEDKTAGIDDSYVRKYAEAIKKACGGTVNGLYAMEVLEDGVQKFDLSSKDASFEIEYVLQKDVENRLKKQGFYEKYPNKKSTAAKIKSLFKKQLKKIKW